MKERTTLVLLRHGSSVANEGDHFGGWADVPLSPLGIEQARQAGRSLREMQFSFDLAICSRLQRSTLTLEYCLEELDASLTTKKNDWRLNERHYGALQGMLKSVAQARFGDDQVWRWRRSFHERPPLLRAGEVGDSFCDARYSDLTRSQVPLGESLKDTAARVSDCWIDVIEPELRDGKCVLVVGHGNSLRTLIMMLEQVHEDELSTIKVPNGVPIVYNYCPVTRQSFRRRR